MAEGENYPNVYALDANSGSLKWRFETTGIIESSPSFCNGMVLIGSNDFHLYNLDIGTGKLAWKFRAEADKIVSSPTVAGHFILVGS
ncbi:MAG: PQQ-binding-like beta-propeller repeat protein [Caldisericia bacterium]|nr:PQQ-binding-like beta-propeller repeat protein [Caldisericia bacterium]